MKYGVLAKYDERLYFSGFRWLSYLILYYTNNMIDIDDIGKVIFSFSTAIKNSFTEEVVCMCSPAASCM